MDSTIREALVSKLDTTSLTRLNDAGEWVESCCPMIEDIIVAWVTRAVRWRYYMAAAGLTRRRVISVSGGERLAFRQKGKLK